MNRFKLEVFKDTARAYNNFLTDSVFKASGVRKTDPNTTEWIKLLLKHSFSLGGTTITVYPTRGTPHWCVLCPFHWNIGFEPILDAANSESWGWVGFADNLAVFVTGPCKRITQILKPIFVADRKQGLTFTGKKSVAVLFGKGHLNSHPPITLGGFIVKW